MKGFPETPKEAKILGEKYYFTGKPCKNDHVDKRLASSRSCYRCDLDRCAAWSAENRDSINKRVRENGKGAKYAKSYRKKYPEKYKQTLREYRQRNKEYFKERDRLKYHQRRSLSGAHTSEQLNDLLKKQKERCAFCFCCIKKEKHLDHIFPVKLGGSNDIDNLQFLCPSCNLKKWAKHPIDFAQENGRLL